jgi:hypothetical protein
MFADGRKQNIAIRVLELQAPQTVIGVLEGDGEDDTP